MIIAIIGTEVRTVKTKQQKQFDRMREGVFAIAKMFQENEAAILLSLCDARVASEMDENVSDLFSLLEVVINEGIS